MRKIAKQQDQDGAEIDLTPMLDVVFIMLIFFIVVASFIKEAGVEAPVYRSFDLAGVVGDAPALAPSPEAFDNVWRQSMPPLVERQTAFRR